MEKETLKRIFYFLEEKENQKAPFMWKLVNNEPFTENKITIKEHLRLSRTNITSLPNDSFVGGDLHLEYCKNLTSLPKGLKVEGNLYIDNTPIANKYSNDEIRDMVKPDGYILGQINR